MLGVRWGVGGEVWVTGGQVRISGGEVRWGGVGDGEVGKWWWG